MSESNASSTEAIKNVIFQAEMAKTKLEMQQCYKKNIAFFEKFSPELFEKFKSYKAQKIWPIYTEEGYINLVNGVDGSLVYPNNPVEYCQDTVDTFLKYPNFAEVIFKNETKIDKGEKRSHVLNVSNLLNYVYAETEGKKTLPANLKSARFLMMRGIGLGYQIEQLFQQVEINYLCLVEPNEDIFFASLHTLDYQKLSSLFTKKNKGFNLIVGVEPNECMRMVLYYLVKIGMHNAARCYDFEHLCSEDVTEATKGFLAGLREGIRSLGFFDDEKYGLAHTVKNLQKNLPVLLDSKQEYDVPVFICANGPSLDTAKDFIKNNSEKAIIISSGSTLGALYKMGITPDFHIENERVLSILKWIQSSSKNEFRNNIKLIGLNPVHPKVISEFKEVGLALKANDLGSSYFFNNLKIKEYFHQLKNCNPTVTNTACSIALALGFKNIYLFGVDLGFSPTGAHHSNYSQYAEIDKSFYENNPIYQADLDGNFKVKGNFYEEIITTANFNQSREALEQLLKENSSAKVMNCSNGVFVAGTQPLDMNEINLKSEIKDKKGLIDKIFKEHFSTNYLTEVFEDKEVINYFENAEISVGAIISLIEKNPNTVSEAFEIMDHVNSIILLLLDDRRTHNQYFLIKGSIYSFLLILSFILEEYQEEKALKMFNHGLNIFRSFMTELEKKMKNELLEIDDYIPEMQASLKAK